MNLLITNKITFNPKLNENCFFAEADLYILNLFFHLLSMQINDCFPSIAGWLVSGYSISFDKFLIVCNVLGAVYKLNRVCRESTRP